MKVQLCKNELSPSEKYLTLTKIIGNREPQIINPIEAIIKTAKWRHQDFSHDISKRTQVNIIESFLF